MQKESLKPTQIVHNGTYPLRNGNLGKRSFLSQGSKKKVQIRANWHLPLPVARTSLQDAGPKPTPIVHNYTLLLYSTIKTDTLANTNKERKKTMRLTLIVSVEEMQ